MLHSIIDEVPTNILVFSGSPTSVFRTSTPADVCQQRLCQAIWNKLLLGYHHGYVPRLGHVGDSQHSVHWVKWSQKHRYSRLSAKPLFCRTWDVSSGLVAVDRPLWASTSSPLTLMTRNAHITHENMNLLLDSQIKIISRWVAFYITPYWLLAFSRCTLLLTALGGATQMAPQ